MTEQDTLFRQWRKEHAGMQAGDPASGIRHYAPVAAYVCRDCGGHTVAATDGSSRWDYWPLADSQCRRCSLLRRIRCQP